MVTEQNFVLEKTKDKPEGYLLFNNNKLYLHDYNKVLQYCKSHLKFNY